MVHIHNLQFGYRKNPLFEDFNLDLSQPGVYGLFGRNGTGKSTLLKLLAGLAFPQAGSITVLGHEPRKRLPNFLQQVCIVPEEFHLPNISLNELLASQAAFYPQFSRSQFVHNAEQFELSLDKKFESLSLGQKKKSVIAFALATNTPVLLMDEPTNGLDIMGRAQFKAIMGSESQKQRLTLISTHQAHDLESLMQHVLFFDTGKLALFAGMAELQTALQMGFADSSATIELPVYQESLGQHMAYVQANRCGEAQPIQLELLYKALITNKAGVLAALAAKKVNGEVRL